jgi:hypothetical protein
VRAEIAQDVADIERQVAPRICGCRRDAPAVFTTELHQAADADAAAPQCRDKLPRSDLVPIDCSRDFDPMGLAECLDPHTAGIVNVSGDHPDRAPGCSGDGGGPQAGRQVLDKEERDAIVGPPGGEDRVAKIRRGRQRGPRLISIDGLHSLPVRHGLPNLPVVPKWIDQTTDAPPVLITDR